MFFFFLHLLFSCLQIAGDKVAPCVSALRDSRVYHEDEDIWEVLASNSVESWLLSVSRTYRETGPDQPGLRLRLGGTSEPTRAEEDEVEPCFPDYILMSGCGAGLSPYMPTYNYRIADRKHIKSLRSGLWGCSCGAPPHTSAGISLTPVHLPTTAGDFPSYSHQKVCALSFSEVDVD